MHSGVLWAEGHFSAMLEIAQPILLLTIGKGNGGCNSGSFEDLQSETSTECNAARENYRNKPVSPKYPVVVVGIQQ